MRKSATVGQLPWQENARHGTTLRWHEKICLSSFCTGGRVIGKSNGRSNRSGDSSWLWPTWSYPDDLTFSVPTLIRQALNRLVGGYAMRTGRSSSGQDCPLSKTSPPEWVRRILPISCSSLGRTDPRMVCPRHEKSCLLRSGLGSNLSWGFDPSWTDGPLTLSDVREDSRELQSFPSSRTTDITLWLIVHCERFGDPPDFSGRQPLKCCRTWEQPSTIGH